MIKAILFDFGQTLVDSADAFRAAEKEAKNRLFSHMESGPGGPSWDVFLPRYRSIRKEFHQDSNFSRQAIWQAVRTLELLGMPVPRPENPVPPSKEFTIPAMQYRHPALNFDDPVEIWAYRRIAEPVSRVPATPALASKVAQ